MRGKCASNVAASSMKPSLCRATRAASTLAQLSGGAIHQGRVPVKAMHQPNFSWLLFVLLLVSCGARSGLEVEADRSFSSGGTSSSGVSSENLVKSPIAAGNLLSCAVHGSGAVQCWGVNVVGELGNGTLKGSARPV